MRPLRDASLAAALTLAAAAVLVGLQAAGIATNVAFTVFWTLATLLMTAAMAFSLYRGDSGGAVAWGYIALILAIGQILLSLQIATMDVSPVCSAIYSSCSIKSPVAWVPCGLGAAAAWLLWGAVRRAKAEAPQL